MSRARGFSLIELVAVLAIFAVVALIGVQVIQAAVRSSDRLTAVSEETAGLAQALALLRQDLNAALPRRFTPPDGGDEPALVTRRSGFSLSVGGLARLNAGATGFGRVTWALDRGTGTLSRSVWPTLTPGRGAPEAVAVLEGVEDFALDSFSVGTGWTDGFSADPRDTSALPLGLRVRMGRGEGTYETLVSLR